MAMETDAEFTDECAYPHCKAPAVKGDIYCFTHQAWPDNHFIRWAQEQKPQRTGWVFLSWDRWDWLAFGVCVLTASVIVANLRG